MLTEDKIEIPYLIRRLLKAYFIWVWMREGMKWMIGNKKRSVLHENVIGDCLEDPIIGMLAKNMHAKKINT